MNTYNTATPAQDHTAPTFRQLLTVIRTAITAAGLVKETATGEINEATATPSGSPDANTGFQVFRFADALQGSLPVFVRIDYLTNTAIGSGVYSTRLALTVGTTHDGAGGIGGQATSFLSAAIPSANLGASGTMRVLAVSGSPGRLALVMCVTQNPTSWAGMTVLGVERLKDNTGADTANGLMVTYGTTTQVVPATGPLPPAETRWTALCSTNNPGRFANQVSIGLVHPIAGSAQRPMTAFAIAPSNAFATAEDALVSCYGVPVPFRALQFVSATTVNLTHQLGVRFLMRWD